MAAPLMMGMNGRLRPRRARPPGRFRRASLNEGDLLIGNGRRAMSNPGFPGPRKLNSGLGKAS
eukprot:5284535-Pyramimonas_sp.AAC.1